ncbi:MAG: hypothetical protein EAZ55_03865 [Cytophagales bacterium]|nr:MAG: hypothetical protein EAZ55_03865 [Cytophagales bacterium]
MHLLYRFVLVGLMLFSTPTPLIVASAYLTDVCLHLKSKPIHLGYISPSKEKKIWNVILFNRETINGKLIEALRFENITKAVEQRYCLPSNIILAMIVQETWGQECVANQTGNNSWGDGGFGLCHMQGLTAEEYGLSTVCNTQCGEPGRPFACYKHAKELGYAIQQYDKCDMKVMHLRDDRLHPIMNIDAVGRILALANGTLQDKVFRYRGGSYEDKIIYWQRVESYRRELNDPNRRKSLENEFNKYNQYMTIDGFLFTNPYKAYLEYYHTQNYYFGLANYKQLGICVNCCAK